MVIHTIDRSSADQIRVTLEDFKGKTYLHVRMWHDRSLGLGRDWIPTQKGITLRADEIEQLRIGIDRALAAVFCSGRDIVGSGGV